MLIAKSKFGTLTILLLLTCFVICKGQSGYTKGELSPIGADKQGIKFSYTQGRKILQDYEYIKRVEDYYIPPMERYVDTLEFRVGQLMEIIQYKDQEIGLLRKQNADLRGTGDNILRTSEVQINILEKKNRQLNFFKPLAIGSLTALLGVILVTSVGE